MDNRVAVERDPRVGSAVSSLQGKPGEWPDQTREAVRQVVAAQVASVQEALDVAGNEIQAGINDQDYQRLIGGLRKALVAGLTAKDSADMFLRWYGQEWDGGL